MIVLILLLFFAIISRSNNIISTFRSIIHSAPRQCQLSKCGRSADSPCHLSLRCLICVVHPPAPPPSRSTYKDGKDKGQLLRIFPSSPPDHYHSQQHLHLRSSHHTHFIPPPPSAHRFSIYIPISAFFPPEKKRKRLARTNYAICKIVAAPMVCAFSGDICTE